MFQVFSALRLKQNPCYQPLFIHFTFVAVKNVITLKYYLSQIFHHFL